MRRLDHIVWPARDLDDLADTFRRLGFQVGRRNRHPWGTVNHIVQFDGCFLELLGFAEDYRRPSTEDPASPFAAGAERFLSRSAGGAAMVVLDSDDAAADARRFMAEGIGHGHLLPFSRAAQSPDGHDRTVSFTVAFSDLPGLPEIGAFTCQQHRPENFWNPAAQRHANGAIGIVSITVALRDLARQAEPLRRFAGQQIGAAEPSDASIPLAGSTIDLAPLSAEAGAQPGIAAVRIAVRDETIVRQVLREAGVPFTAWLGRLAVAPAQAGGTELVFVAA